MAQNELDEAAIAGSALYTRPILALYDWGVLGLSNTWVWQCPTSYILEFYNAHISANHLDIGVGTGFLLDKCRYPRDRPLISLLDLNPNSLHMAAGRISRYKPTTYLANVLSPLPLPPTTFDSVGINYLLHCLPGTMRDKGVVFANLKPFLHSGSVVFGTTILGHDLQQNPLARALLAFYNATHVFTNNQDGLADLDYVLRKHFQNFTLTHKGCVAFFTGQI